MGELPPSPTMTRLHRESKDVFIRLFDDGVPGASLNVARSQVAERYGCAGWEELREAVKRLQNGLPGEPDAAHLDVLVASGTKAHKHSGSRLYDHLLGTRDLLAEWGNPHHVAIAGLFHSIYGTQSYKISSVPLERRREIAESIGDEAETLAYIFCVSDRKDFFTQLGRDSPVLKDVVHGTSLAVSEQSLQELIELEVANCVEQIYPERADPPTVSMLKRMLHAPMSGGARVSLAELISKCEVAPSGGPRGALGPR